MIEYKIDLFIRVDVVIFETKLSKMGINTDCANKTIQDRPIIKHSTKNSFMNATKYFVN